MSVLGDAAMEYATRGWPVFPLQVRGKAPLTAHGFRDASREQAQVRAWWERWPDANVGVPTGAATFDALDLDGDEGIRVIAALEEEHGRIPAGPRQRTGGGGMHIMFVGGALGTSTRRLPGVDTRGRGGYVVMAPSIHRTGVAYVLEDEDEPLVEPPSWLLDVLQSQADGRQAARRPTGPAAVVTDDVARNILEMARVPLVEIREGERNERLFRIAASLRGQGQELPQILFLVSTTNRHLCRPPTTDEEVQRICRSAANYAVGESYQHVFSSVRAAEQRAEQARAAQTEAELRSQEEARTASDREQARALRAQARSIAASARVQQAERARREAEERAGEAASAAAFGEEQRAASQSGNVAMLRQLVARELGHSLTRIIQRGRDNASYYFDVGDGREPVYVGKSLLDQRPIADAMLRSRLKATGLAKLSAKRWSTLRDALRDLVVQEDEVEAERTTQTISILREMYGTGRSRGSLARDATKVLRRLAFVDGEHLYVTSKGVSSYVLQTTGQRLSIHDVSALLKEAGATRPGGHGVVSERDASGNRIQANYFCVPVSALGYVEPDGPNDASERGDDQDVD